MPIIELCIPYSFIYDMLEKIIIYYEKKHPARNTFNYSCIYYIYILICLVKKIQHIVMKLQHMNT